jgi:hypothetical protein
VTAWQSFHAFRHSSGTSDLWAFLLIGGLGRVVHNLGLTLRVPRPLKQDEKEEGARKEANRC